MSDIPEETAQLGFENFDQADSERVELELPDDSFRADEADFDAEPEH